MIRKIGKVTVVGFLVFLPVLESFVLKMQSFLNGFRLFFFQFSTAVQVTEDLISFTELLVYIGRSVERLLKSDTSRDG